MINIELISNPESNVRTELETLLAYARAHHHDLPRDLGGFFSEEILCWIYQILEGNKFLRQRLKIISQAQDFKPDSIADFCCGNGNGTLRIAQDFLDSQVFGFDVMPDLFKRVKQKNKDSRIHFEKLDVYELNGSNYFDLVAFHNACGPLSDKIMQYAINQKAPIIAGRFCCHYTISSEIPNSKNKAFSYYVKLRSFLQEIIREKTAKNYGYSAQDKDRDLLSEFSKHELGMNEQELEKIALASIDSRIATKIIDLNRVMKLIERGYDVEYTSEKNMFVALRRT